jgi:predicted nucleic acid-binding protein
MILLAEVGGAMARRSGNRRVAQDAVDRLKNSGEVNLFEIDDELADHSASIAVQLGLRGANAVYVALAEGLGMPLVTWDGEQRERGRIRVRVVTPGEALGEMG